MCFQRLEVLISEVTDWFAFLFPLVMLSFISISIFIQILISSRHGKRLGAIRAIYFFLAFLVDLRLSSDSNSK